MRGVLAAPAMHEPGNWVCYEKVHLSPFLCLQEGHTDPTPCSILLESDSFCPFS